MNYRYYGKTEEQSVERDMADLKWAEKRGNHAVRKLAAGHRVGNIITVLVVGLFLFGVGALVVWGIGNLASSGGDGWLLFLFNPITIVICIVGGAWSAMNRA